MRREQRRQLRAKHHAEAVIFDVPAHDVLGPAPEMIAGSDDSSVPNAPAALRVAQHDAGRAVGE